MQPPYPFRPHPACLTVGYRWIYDYVALVQCSYFLGYGSKFDPAGHTAHCYHFDIQNCSPPALLTGYDIIARIRTATEKFGIIKVLKAYTEVNTSSSRSIVMRSELQSSGVTMIDCPHSGHKDVVDKMIIGTQVELSMFAT